MEVSTCTILYPVSPGKGFTSKQLVLHTLPIYIAFSLGHCHSDSVAFCPPKKFSGEPVPEEPNHCKIQELQGKQSFCFDLKIQSTAVKTSKPASGQSTL